MAPENIASLHAKAELYENLGEYLKSIEVLHTIGDRDSSTQTVLKIIELNLLIGRVTEAFDLLSTETTIGESDIIKAAMEAMRIGEWELTADFLAKEFVNYTQSTTIHYLCGLALMESQQYAEAKAVFGQLIRSDFLLTYEPIQPPDLFNPAKAGLSHTDEWVSFYVKAGHYRAQSAFMADFRGTAYFVILRLKLSGVVASIGLCFTGWISIITQLIESCWTIGIPS